MREPVKNINIFLILSFLILMVATALAILDIFKTTERRKERK